MTLIVISIAFMFILALVEWKTAAIRGVLASATRAGSGLAAWVTDGQGPYRLLPEMLAYREFYSEGVVETTRGILWCALEVQVPATDGCANRDFNHLGEALGRAISVLPAKTQIQIINRISMHSDDAFRVLEKMRDQAPLALAPVYQARIDFLKAEARAGRIRSRSTWVFIGIEPPSRMVGLGIRLRGLFSPLPWVDLERNEHIALRNTLETLCGEFAARMKDAGGECRAVSGGEIMSLAYERLNPARAQAHPAPRYEQDLNPRELLCCTNVDIEREHLKLGDVYAATLSLHRFATRVSPKTMESLFRSGTIGFDVDICAHFRVENWLNYDRRLDREEADLQRRLTTNPSPDQDVKLEQIQSVRRQLRTGDEKIGLFGFAVTVTAPTELELRRRLDIVIAEVRKCEGMELVVERTWPLEQYLATLPCSAHTDRRERPVLSRHAAWLMGFSGEPTGMTPREASIVFQLPDGGVLLWDQTSERHVLNNAVVCGQSGSGKSALMMLLRFAHLSQGRRGFVIDYRTSGRRLVKLMDGIDVDITNPSAAPFLADLFDAWPRGSDVRPEELTEEGLLRDRVYEVEELLARLCSEELDHVKRVFLNRAIRRTYCDLSEDDVPTMDDFLHRIGNSTREERESSYWLSERLSLYRSDQALGMYFNQRGNAIDFSEARLINFDFASSKGNSKLLLIGTLAAKMVIERALFSARARAAGSFLHVDEFGMLAQSPVLARTVDDLVRTARKYDMQITLASQRAEDFVEQENIRAIATDLPVRYLFKMAADTAAKAFNLTLGEAQMVAGLSSGGSEYRDCALIAPSGRARIRLRHGPVEGRLFMEAATGKEAFTAKDAISMLPANAPEALVSALELEPRRIGQSALQEAKATG